MLGVMKATFKPGKPRTERQQQAQPAAKEVDVFSFLFDPESFTQVGGWVGG